MIDARARDQLLAHVAQLAAVGRLVHACCVSDDCARGTFVAPHLFAIDSIQELSQEHFGPLLHVVRYRSQDVHKHLEELRATGFGLTLPRASAISPFYACSKKIEPQVTRKR